MSKLTITVAENESDLWAIEEPPEPVITVTYDQHCWIVYGDENADHKDFEEQWWPSSRAGEIAKATAFKYAKDWAKAVRGVWEEV